MRVAGVMHVALFPYDETPHLEQILAHLPDKERKIILQDDPFGRGYEGPLQDSLEKLPQYKTLFLRHYGGEDAMNLLPLPDILTIKFVVTLEDLTGGSDPLMRILSIHQPRDVALESHLRLKKASGIGWGKTVLHHHDSLAELIERLPAGAYLQVAQGLETPREEYVLDASGITKPLVAEMLPNGTLSIVPAEPL